jgi:DNA invertase Pin-like site-specific DNA recombinase
MALVHSYLRFSTTDQEDGDSIGRQNQEAIAFCEKHNHTLSSLRFEDLGRSGFRKKNLKKSGLEAFLVAIKKGKIKAGDILFVEAIDRLSRSGIAVTQEIVREIHKAKVDIAIAFPFEKLFKHDTKNELMDTITLAVYADVAHQYSLRLSGFGKSWWQSARKEARENGVKIAAVLPYWVTRKGSKFGKDKEKSAVVKLIYQLAIKGLGASRICKELHERKIPAPRGETWNKTFVRKVIRDRATLGEMQFHEIDEKGGRVPIGELITDYYPRIIKDDMWLKANAKLDQRFTERGPSSDYVNLFQGITWNVHINQK